VAAGVSFAAFMPMGTRYRAPTYRGIGKNMDASLPKINDLITLLELTEHSNPLYSSSPHEYLVVPLFHALKQQSHHSRG
jgi:hypothetical protein